jgi:hypothetical protein
MGRIDEFTDDDHVKQMDTASSFASETRVVPDGTDWRWQDLSCTPELAKCVIVGDQGMAWCSKSSTFHGVSEAQISFFSPLLINVSLIPDVFLNCLFLA